MARMILVLRELYQVTKRDHEGSVMDTQYICDVWVEADTTISHPDFQFAVKSDENIASIGTLLTPDP